MTVSSTWYDKQQQRVQEQEMYFTAVRSGNIETVRRTLAKRGISYFQQRVYRETKRWIPERRIKARFERERPADKAEALITIEPLKLERIERRWKASRMKPTVISYAKRKRRRRIRR